MKRQAGKLYTSNPSGLKHLEQEAEVWQITRGGVLIPGAVLVRALAPSQALFSKYLSEWKDLPANQWWEDYKKQFVDELTSEEPILILRALYKKLIGGTSVVLLCLCKDYNYCHRKLVGEFFVKYDLEATELAYEEPKPQGPIQLSLFDGVI